jgi:hypothetical protein
MVRLTASTIHRMRREGRTPPPPPRVINRMNDDAQLRLLFGNSNSNSNNNNNNNNNSNNQMMERVKQLMTDHIEIRRRYPNNLPNHVKTNVSTYYNNSFTNTEVKNIPKNKRVYITKDLVNGKVKHVYNQDGIIKLLLRNKQFAAKSPISRRKFDIKNVIPFT